MSPPRAPPPGTTSWCPWCGDNIAPGVLFCCTDCCREYQRDVREELARKRLREAS